MLDNIAPVVHPSNFLTESSSLCGPSRAPIPVQLLRQHKVPLVFLAFARGGWPLVSVDKAAYINIWANHDEAFMRFGW